MRIVALLLALAVVAGCGDDADTASTDATPSTGSDTPVTSPEPSEPASGDQMPGAPEPRQVTPTPGLVNVNPAAVESYRQITDTDVELRFYSGVEECYGLDHVDVDAGPESVTVTVFAGSKPGDRACIEIAELVATKIALDEPLGSRTLIDGSTGEPVPVD